MGIKKMLIVLAAVFLSGIVYSAPVTVDLGVTVNTNTCDTINWTDSYGLPRSASVVKALGNPHG
ncbi:MAG TPA: hypothetical protein PKJ42_05545, partial [Candidatus Goldiibacteriota bacterium]|nr:hypothetical protein [Candidatus Goldiibacteriota bacterium]